MRARMRASREAVVPRANAHSLFVSLTRSLFLLVPLAQTPALFNLMPLFPFDQSMLKLTDSVHSQLTKICTSHNKVLVSRASFILYEVAQSMFPLERRKKVKWGPDQEIVEAKRAVALTRQVKATCLALDMEDAMLPTTLLIKIYHKITRVRVHAARVHARAARVHAHAARVHAHAARVHAHVELLHSLLLSLCLSLLLSSSSQLSCMAGHPLNFEHFVCVMRQALYRIFHCSSGSRRQLLGMGKAQAGGSLEELKSDGEDDGEEAGSTKAASKTKALKTKAVKTKATKTKAAAKSASAAQDSSAASAAPRPKGLKAKAKVRGEAKLKERPRRGEGVRPRAHSLLTLCLSAAVCVCVLACFNSLSRSPTSPWPSTPTPSMHGRLTPST